MCCLSPLSFGSVEYEKRSENNALEPCALFGDRKEWKATFKVNAQAKNVERFFCKRMRGKKLLLYYYF